MKFSPAAVSAALFLASSTAFSSSLPTAEAFVPAPSSSTATPTLSRTSRTTPENALISPGSSSALPAFYYNFNGNEGYSDDFDNLGSFLGSMMTGGGRRQRQQQQKFGMKNDNGSDSVRYSDALRVMEDVLQAGGSPRQAFERNGITYGPFLQQMERVLRDSYRTRKTRPSSFKYSDALRSMEDVLRQGRNPREVFQRNGITYDETLKNFENLLRSGNGKGLGGGEPRSSAHNNDLYNFDQKLRGNNNNNNVNRGSPTGSRTNPTSRRRTGAYTGTPGNELEG